MVAIQSSIEQHQPHTQAMSSHNWQLIPGPTSASLLGWRGDLLKYFRNPIAYMTHLRETYGDIARFSTGQHKSLLLDPDPANCFTLFGFGAECNRQILSQPDIFQKRNPRGPNTRLNKLLINNVAMVTSQKQKDQRRQIMPAFSRKHLQFFYEPMVQSANETVEQWRNQENILAFDEMLALSARIAVRCIYGVDPHNDHNNLATLMRDLNDVVFSPAAMVPVNFPGTPYRKGITIGNDVYKAVCTEIATKRAQGAQGFDVLSLMLNAMEKNPSLMTEDELIGNVYIMFFAGYETSSLTLAWILFLLAQHPEVMAALMNEFDNKLHGGPPTFDQLYELPLLDRVIKESMRVLGPTVAFPRFVASPTTLGPYEIPVGTEVMYSPYMTHMDPDIFPEPKKFRPERWETIRPSAYEYLPFGSGARSCMGTSFASMQVRLVLPIILQEYRLQIAENCKMNILAHTQVRPSNGLPMRVHKQDRQFHRSKTDLRGDILQMVDFS